MEKVDFFNAKVIMTGEAEEINYEHQMFLDSMRTGLEHAIHCGDLLREKKAELAHGEWLPWVMLNCNFSAREAQRYMALASNATRVSHLSEQESIRIALELLRELKYGERPEEVVQVGVFSWAKDERIVSMWDWFDGIEKNILILQHSEEDPITANYFVDMVEKKLENILQILRHNRGKNGTPN